MNNTIEYPYVDFSSCKERFDKFTKNFNVDKKLQKQLRLVHYELFYALIRLYIKTIQEHNDTFSQCPDMRAINPLKPPALFTNNVMLSNQMHNSEDSVYRHLLRLKTAGVISKKYHGANHNYELAINPEFLGFLDISQSAEKQVAYAPPNATCGLSQNIQETFNNITIPVQKGINVNVDDSIETTTGNQEGINASVDVTIETSFTGNTRKNQENTADAQVFSKEYQKKLKESGEMLRGLKASFSAWLYSLAISCLWLDREIHEGEKIKALQYLESNYFEHCNTYADFDRTMKEFNWRIEAAGRNIKKKDFGENWFVFPVHYFDLSNSKGFRGTKQWYLLSKENTRRRAERNRRKTDLEKLSEQIKLYLKTPDVPTFIKCENYVKDNIPNMLKQYKDSIINGGKLQYSYE